MKQLDKGDRRGNNYEGLSNYSALSESSTAAPSTQSALPHLKHGILVESAYQNK